MNMKKIITSVLLSLALVACSHNEPGTGINDGKIKVSIGQQATISSRTSIGDDGHSAVWSDGDKIALWAINEAGEAVLQAESFALYHFAENYSRAIFTAFINPMQSGSYTYYATYPTPKSVSGTLATYTLADTQQGSGFVGSCDIMVASSVTAQALTEEKVNNLGLHFSHKMHALRIVLPEDASLMGKAIDAIEFEFPTEVVGDVTVDAANPTAPATLSNGSNRLTITIPEGYVSGNYVWGLIFPTTITEDVKYRVYAGEYISKFSAISLNKEAQQSHITPMSVAIPNVDLTTTITINVDGNNLGEDYNTISVINNQGETIGTFAANSSHSYDINIEGVLDPATISGKQYRIRYESANAIVEDNITMPTIVPYRPNSISSTVPYLLFEDFSAAKQSEYNDSYAGSANQDGTMTGHLLNDYMTTNGWNAARYRLEAGKAIRINVRYESGGFVVARYCGRLDTPALKGIKSGANVNVKLEFDLACYVPIGYRLLSSLDDTGNSVTSYKIATHTSSESSAINGENQNSISGIYSSDTFVRNVTEDTFDCKYWQQSLNISGCTSNTRITWYPQTTQSSSLAGANCVYYIYIDNIKVSIAK